MMPKVQPGDVLCIRTGDIFGEVIRWGAGLIGKDNLENHIAVVHHTDKAGVIWGIEGKPGGVGWVDCKQYLAESYTMSNFGQIKSDEQRVQVCATMSKLIGEGYDWRAILEDGINDLHIPDPWQEKWGPVGIVPGHVVCSSAAVVAYDAAKLARPTDIDPAHIQPGDWADFIIQHNYQ